jgi:hypothetical protein
LKSLAGCRVSRTSSDLLRRFFAFTCTQTDFFEVKGEPYSSELSSVQQHSYASSWQYCARRP